MNRAYDTVASCMCASPAPLASPLRVSAIDRLRHPIPSHNITSHHIRPHHITSHHIASHHSTAHHTTSLACAVAAAAAARAPLARAPCQTAQAPQISASSSTCGGCRRLRGSRTPSRAACTPPSHWPAQRSWSPLRRAHASRPLAPAARHLRAARCTERPSTTLRVHNTQESTAAQCTPCASSTPFVKTSIVDSSCSCLRRTRPCRRSRFATRLICSS